MSNPIGPAVLVKKYLEDDSSKIEPNDFMSFWKDSSAEDKEAYTAAAASHFGVKKLDDGKYA